ncbi:MAG: AraC family transcriptional regulator [Clostridiales bacterium]|nr:AraC family transcriptional regulator [Clostridiales bacterium]
MENPPVQPNSACDRCPGVWVCGGASCGPAPPGDCLGVVFCREGQIQIDLPGGRSAQMGEKSVLLVDRWEAACPRQVPAAPAGTACILLAVDRHRVAGRPLPAPLDWDAIDNLLEDRGGCAALERDGWTAALFQVLARLPAGEQADYCAFKVLELLYLLSRQGLAAAAAPWSAYYDSRQIQVTRQVHDYMLSHLEEHLTIPGLSNRFHVSPTLLKSCFRQLYGSPLHTCLRQHRLRRGGELLRTTSLPIAEVAAQVGYGSVSQFGAAFRNEFGVSPSLYRKQFSEDCAK